MLLNSIVFWQVFWLAPVWMAFPSYFEPLGFKVLLLWIQRKYWQWQEEIFKPFKELTAAGTAPDSHRIPFYRPWRIHDLSPKSSAKIF